LILAPARGDEPTDGGSTDGVEDEDEDKEEEEQEYADEDLLEPDPFISQDGPVIEALSTGDIERLRAEAMALALSGEHRILLSDIAGPGTLAEALDRLLQDGKVAAEFHDPDGEEPYIRYTALGQRSAEGRPDELGGANSNEVTNEAVCKLDLL
jgi:hypothetical protein